MDTPVRLAPLYPSTRHLGSAIDVGGCRTVRAFQPEQHELATAMEAAVLVDLSPLNRYQIEGQATDKIVQQVFGVAGLEVGRGVQSASAAVYCIRADLMTIVANPAVEPKLLDKLEAAATSIEPLATVTDITHGKAHLWLAGAAAATVLSRVCGLDFDDRSFPNNACAVSSVAKTTQLIIRHDLQKNADAVKSAYSVIGDRSLAVYMWETVLEAGESLGLVPAGWSLYAALATE